MLRKVSIVPIVGAALLSLSTTVAFGQEAAGAREWIKCHACHTIIKGEPHKIGPNLSGVANAKAGTRSGYAYSKALANSGIVWDRAMLDRWIEKPTAVLRGHKMIFVGISDSAKRRALIDYIFANSKSSPK